MSRIDSMSPDALKAIFSPNSDANLIALVSITNVGTSPIYIADGFTERIREEDEYIVYGVKSRGIDYMFLPIEISLPTEEEAQAPRASLTIHDVTRELTPIIRGLTEPPSIKIELVLNSSPDTVEVTFDYFYISSISYNRDSISCELSMINLDREPFPVHTFTPAYFPGLF